MTLDILALVLALVFAVMGWRSGAVAQCMRVVAAIGAFLAASPVARLAADILFPQSGLSGPVLEVVVLVGSGIAVYIVLAVAGWLFARALWAASDSLTILDRSGGLALGLVKTLILVYFLVAAVAMMKVPLQRVDEKDALHLRDSRILSVVEDYNVLVPWRFADLDRLHDALKVKRATRERKVARLVRENAEAADFLRSPEMRELAEDEAVFEAALRDRYYRTLADSKVRECLDDEEFVGRLRIVDWERLLEQVRRGHS